jgi:hypothetical protein
VLAELPFTTADAIAAEYKPGARVTPKAALRTLRDKAVVSEGVRISPRDDRGRVVGARHLYSSINLDAVRLFRDGKAAEARRLAAKAQAIETSAAAARFTKELTTKLHENAPLYEVITTNYDALLEGLTEMTRETEAVRVQGRVGRAVFARVVAYLEGDLAQLALEDGAGTFAMPIGDLGEWTLRVGAGVSMRWEVLGSGMSLLKAAPAIDVEIEQASDAYPFDRPLPAETERLSIPGLLRGTPTVRRPRTIPIAGDK